MLLGIVAQNGNTHAAYLADELRTALPSNVGVLIDPATATELDIDGTPLNEFKRADLVVSVGGDGTFLFTAREVGPVPIVGVNLGEVGFLNAVSPQHAIELIQQEVEQYRERGTVLYRELNRLQASVDGWTSNPALNEIAVIGPHRGRGGGIGVELRIDGALYSGGYADGALIATPTGSTAYNLSEGGPLVHPTVEAFVATEMCANEPMRPLVFHAGASATIRVDDAESAVVVTDGSSPHEIEPPASIRIERANDPVRLAGPPLEFFDALGKLA